MIGSLRGTLAERDARGVVLVDVGGVGYEVNVTGLTSISLGEIGADVVLRVHTRVREDAITLFGFSTSEERRCFEILIGAHGVGPAMAMALLSLHTPSSLRRIVINEDADALSQVPGIGKKTAARLLVELQTKFDDEPSLDILDAPAPTASRASSSARADVATALAGLGYSADEVRQALARLPDDGATEDLLRLALRELAAAS